MDWILSIMIASALALAAGAMFRLRRGERGVQVWLMLVLSAVIAANAMLLPA